MRLHHPPHRLLSLAATSLLLAACDDSSPSDPNPAVSGSSAIAQQDVPSRDEEQKGSWGGMATQALWDHGAPYDHVYMVGLKLPGRARGVWRDKVLVTAEEVQAGRRALHMAGAEVLSMDPILPIARVRMESAAALERVRRLPYVDYVDGLVGGADAREVAARLAVSRTPGGMGVRTSSGDSGSGCSTPTDFTDWYGNTAEGDLITWSHEPRYNNVINAWRRSKGDNVRVALLDTGIDAYQPQLNSRFTMNPWGLTRQIYKEYATAAGWGQPWQDTCGHGTRMAGVIAAPQDGQNVVGTAPMADLISVRVGGDVMVFNAGYVIDAIHIAMNPSRPAHIITMAFGTTSTFSSLSDVIRYYYYRKDSAGKLNGPLFIAATGTSGPNFFEPLNNDNVLYPAELPEVMAVTGARPDGYKDSWAHGGAETQLAGYIRQGTVGAPGIFGPSPNITGIDAASGGSASVTGIAALVLSRYPHLTNMALRQHLIKNASRYPNHSNDVGYGTVYAYKAVGGFAGLMMTGNWSVYPNTTHTYQALPYGDGPFTYLWNNGTTGKTATYSFGEYGNWVSVTVTDTVEGVSQTVQQYIEVSNGSYTPPCDPNLDPMCPW
jgi:hypothetical protein